MAFILDDRVRETTITAGTGSITTAGAPGGFQPFSAVMSVGDTCWYAIVSPGTAWETGLGSYTGTNTIARTSVISSSNAGSLVNFPVGSKDIFITQPAKKAQPFPSGTLMLFQQSAAPVFWTKQTTHNDKALRVVSGAVSSGGANSFSSVLVSTIAVSNTTITQSTMASHVHGYVEPAPAFLNVGPGASIENVSLQAANTSSIGGDATHNHLLSINVQYVDLILASKD
jgi:hypothetical protein